LPRERTEKSKGKRTDHMNNYNEGAGKEKGALANPSKDNQET
jgi:hypothetical protein